MAATHFSRSTSATAPVARLSTFISSVFGAAVNWNEARQTRNALSALTDRELNDIGLVRGDIDAVTK